MTADKIPSFKLLHETLPCKIVIQMARKGGVGQCHVAGRVGICVCVSLSAYMEKSKNLPQNFSLHCCSLLLQISSFTPKFWHILAENVSQTVSGSAVSLLNRIFSSSVSLFWHKQLPGRVASPTLHVARQEDMVILGHFWLKVFNQLFWFSVAISVFQWKVDIFHIFLLVKSSGVLSKSIFWQNFFNHFHVESWSQVLWEGKRAALALAKVLQSRCYPRQEGLELVGVCQEKKGGKKTTICSLKLYNWVSWQ